MKAKMKIDNFSRMDNEVLFLFSGGNNLERHRELSCAELYSRKILR